MQAKEEGLTVKEIIMRLQDAKEKGQEERLEAEIAEREERTRMCEYTPPINPVIHINPRRALNIV